MSKAKSKPIIVISIILCVAIITTATVSWFVNYSINKVNGYNVSVNLGNIVQCSLDGKTYSNSLTVNFANGVEYPDFKMIDITGNGATFLRPVLTQTESIAVPNVDATWTEPIPNKDYISFKLYFKASTALDIYLGEGSTVTPRSSSKEINKSNYGDFTRDGIAGASRVSFLDREGNLTYVWAPNPNYELSYDDENGYQMNYDGTPEDSYEYYNAQKEVIQFTSDEIITKPNVSLESDVPSNAKKLVSLSENTQDKNFYGQIIINIWVEGTDREARRALEGGVFNTDFQFVAFSSQKN